MNFKQISEEFGGASAIEINSILDECTDQCQYYWGMTRELPRKMKKRARKEIKSVLFEIEVNRMIIALQLAAEYRANTMLLFDVMNPHTQRISDKVLAFHDQQDEFKTNHRYGTIDASAVDSNETEAVSVATTSEEETA